MKIGKRTIILIAILLVLVITILYFAPDLLTTMLSDPGPGAPPCPPGGC